MTAKEYLNQIYRLKIRIEAKTEQLQELRGLVSFSNGLRYDKERVQTSPKPGMPEEVDRMIDLEIELEREINRYVQLKDTIIDQIGRLENPLYAQLLYKRYVLNNRLSDIARSGGLRYSYRGINKLHKKALLAFSEKYSKEFDEKS